MVLSAGRLSLAGVAADLSIPEVVDTANYVVPMNLERDLMEPDTGAGASRARRVQRGGARVCRHATDAAISAGRLCCPSVSSEHMFEHLGDAVVAGCGCEVVGGRDRVWMTA